MATEKRVYKVTTPTGVRLVKAGNKIQAHMHVARSTITADLASQDDLIDLVGKGVKVEEAGEEPAAGGGEPA